MHKLAGFLCSWTERFVHPAVNTINGGFRAYSVGVQVDGEDAAAQCIEAGGRVGPRPTGLPYRKGCSVSGTSQNPVAGLKNEKGSTLSPFPFVLATRLATRRYSVSGDR
ncbi:hypothetical protein CT0861_12176 [Colletotrichum tofieldiae]|uniref:Uncharacterized protein n=1 Tax=Colletotrichum tofieldiae TaxID=708197 RepID=A0A166SSC7_9PEZI|nr:hypothetical protein CT0861_12176 [Colletotrichum tofieldiae]